MSFRAVINFHFENSLTVNDDSDYNLYSHYIARSQFQKACESLACESLMSSSVHALRILVAVCGDRPSVTDSAAPSC